MKTNMEKTKILIGGRNDVIVAEVNGKERVLFKLSDYQLFTTLKEFAIQYEKDYLRVIHLFNSGLTLAEILKADENPVETIKTTKTVTNTLPTQQPKDKEVDPARSMALTGIPHTGIECNFEDVDYISLKSCAEAYGVNPNTFYTRRYLGYSMYECIHGRNGSKKSKLKKSAPKSSEYYIPVTVDGKAYKSVMDFSKENNVSYKAAIARYHAGTELSPILNPYRVLKPRKSKKEVVDTSFEFHGKKYTSDEELASTYNIPLYTYNKRKMRGWSKEECLFGKQRTDRTRTECSHDGIWYPSLLSLTICLGLNYDQFIADRRSGLSISECVKNQQSIAV